MFCGFQVSRITVAKAFEWKMPPWKDGTDGGMNQLYRFKCYVLVLFLSPQI